MATLKDAMDGCGAAFDMFLEHTADMSLRGDGEYAILRRAVIHSQAYASEQKDEHSKIGAQATNSFDDGFAIGARRAYADMEARLRKILDRC